MVFRKGYLSLNDYAWQKRISALIISFGCLVMINHFYQIEIWKWMSLLFYAFWCSLWYGSHVQIESTVLGFRFGLFYFLLVLAIQLQNHSFNGWMLTISSVFLIQTLVVSWSYPRVKLGLLKIKPINDMKISSISILILYNLISYFIMSKNLILNGINSLAAIFGFIFLYSTYSKIKFYHFIFITYLFFLALGHFLVNLKFEFKSYLLILILYGLFILIQKNSKPKIERK